jgi:hypothetical protein
MGGLYDTATLHALCLRMHATHQAFSGLGRDGPSGHMDVQCAPLQRWFLPSGQVFSTGLWIVVSGSTNMVTQMRSHILLAIVGLVG